MAARGAASRQTAEGHGDPLLPTPPLARDPRQLAEDGNHADSHYCCPEVLDWCRSNGLDYIFGAAPTTTLRVHIETLEAKARFEAAPKDGKLCRFKEFFDGAASWSRVEQIIACSRSETKAPIHASSSPILTSATLACSTKMSTAGAARRKITSSPGRHIWRPTEHRARRRPPTSSGCSCTAGATGSCGACAPQWPNLRCGASRNSTSCACG